jgi:cytochrome c5
MFRRTGKASGIGGAVVALSACLLCSGANAQGAQAAADDGGQLLREACVQCHSPRPIQLTRDGPGGWRDTVERMVVFGARLEAGEVDELVAYLSGQFGPGTDRMTSGKLPPDAVWPDGQHDDATAPDDLLPPGEGRELIAALCTGCHDGGRILATRRSDESWSRYVREMLAQGQIDPSPDQLATMVAYLQANFGDGR